MASISPKPIEPQPTGVPADYLDPNHPQFPHDVEAQPFVRPHYVYVPFMSKKTANIVAIALFVMLSLLAAVLVGGKIGMGAVKRPVPPAPTEIETVYMTTTVVSTTLVPTMHGPGTTTITTTTMLPPPTPTPAPSSSNPFPVAPAFSWTPPPPSPSPEPPKEEKKPEPPKEEQKPEEKGECFWVGRWSTKKECEEKCAEMNSKTGQEVVCGENRGFYQCQTCKTK